MSDFHIFILSSFIYMCANFIAKNNSNKGNKALFDSNCMTWHEPGYFPEKRLTGALMKSHKQTLIAAKFSLHKELESGA